MASMPNVEIKCSIKKFKKRIRKLVKLMKSIPPIKIKVAELKQE